jgi:transposase
MAYCIHMKGYSIDLRQRVLAAVERGMPRPEIVRTFGVSLGTIKRLLAKQRIGADLAPRAPSGRRRTIAPEQHAALQDQLDAHPDATFAQHAELWNAMHGTALSQWTLGRAIRRVGWTRKKRR